MGRGRLVQTREIARASALRTIAKAAFVASSASPIGRALETHARELQIVPREVAENVRGPGPVLVHAPLQLERVQRRRHGVEGPGRQKRVHLDGGFTASARARRGMCVVANETSVVKSRRGQKQAIGRLRLFASLARDVVLVCIRGSACLRATSTRRRRRRRMRRRMRRRHFHSSTRISPLPSRTGSWPPSLRFSRTRKTPRRRVQTGTQARRAARWRQRVLLRDLDLRAVPAAATRQPLQPLHPLQPRREVLQRVRGRGPVQQR